MQEMNTMLDKYEMHLDQKIINSKIVDIEWHPETGEMLTLWIRSPTGELIYIIPTGYKLAYSECDWAEEFHGLDKHNTVKS
jgi:hypothetical protein